MIDFIVDGIIAKTRPIGKNTRRFVSSDGSYAQVKLSHTKNAPTAACMFEFGVVGLDEFVWQLLAAANPTLYCDIARKKNAPAIFSATQSVFLISKLPEKAEFRTLLVFALASRANNDWDALFLNMSFERFCAEIFSDGAKLNWLLINAAAGYAAFVVVREILQKYRLGFQLPDLDEVRLTLIERELERQKLGSTRAFSSFCISYLTGNVVMNDDFPLSSFSKFQCNR